MDKKVGLFVFLLLVLESTTLAYALNQACTGGDDDSLRCKGVPFVSDPNDPCKGKYDDPPSCRTCIDTDGGKNVLESGSAGTVGQFVWFLAYDSCDFSQEGKIYEAYCETETSYGRELMNCPSEKPFCNKGKCTSEEPRCTENDGGKNHLVMGTTHPPKTQGPHGSTDHCQIFSNGRAEPIYSCSGPDCTLTEYFCDERIKDEEDAFAQITLSCPDGCREGVCSKVEPYIIPDPIVVEPDCTDSDGGKNVLESGQAGSIVDFCDYANYGENKVLETYCVNEKMYDRELMDCPSEKPFCNKGKCTSEKPACVENDDGENPLVLGTTTPATMADHPGSTDYCQKASTGKPLDSCSGPNCSLREFFCAQSAPVELFTDFPCTSGCNKGVCSKVESVPSFSSEMVPDKGINQVKKVEEFEVLDHLNSYPCPEECKGGICPTTCPVKQEIITNQTKTIEPKQQVEEVPEEELQPSQEEITASCNSNSECSTNSCVDHQCVSRNFWQKVISFFKVLFD